VKHAGHIRDVRSKRAPLGAVRPTFALAFRLEESWEHWAALINSWPLPALDAVRAEPR